MPGGLYATGTPAPAQPPLHGLQASAAEVTDPTRWELGFAIGPEGCVNIAYWDPTCVAVPDGETKPTKSVFDRTQLASYQVDPFVIESSFECDAQSLKTIDFKSRARRQLEAATSKGMEFEFWTGIQKPDNPVLSQGATVIGGGVAMSPLTAFAMLGSALSNSGSGGRGTIHAPTWVVDIWQHLNLITAQGPRLVSVVRGDVVIAGSGYPGTGPDNAAVDPGESWVYATGPVNYRLGEIAVYPETVEEAVVRRSNDAEYRAERFAAVNFDPCGHFGLLLGLDLGSGQ